MTFAIDTLSAKISEKFSHLIHQSIIASQELTLEVASQHLLELCVALRDTTELEFDMLIDVCGVDYAHYGLAEWETNTATSTGFERGVQPLFSPVIPRSEATRDLPNNKEIPRSARDDSTHQNDMPSRFASVYHLLSISRNHRVRLKVFVDDKTHAVPSVVDIWPAANWFEREAFDLFGIHYTGHPDLRRILTDYGFMGHPFRKDFPLIGKVEARYDAKTKQVIYEPVSIQPRILEPKVIRHDNRYETGEQSNG